MSSSIQSGLQVRQASLEAAIPELLGYLDGIKDAVRKVIPDDRITTDAERNGLDRIRNSFVGKLLAFFFDNPVFNEINRFIMAFVGELKDILFEGVGEVKVPGLVSMMAAATDAFKELAQGEAGNLGNLLNSFLKEIESFLNGGKDLLNLFKSLASDLFW